MTIYSIGNGALSARISDYGATLVDLRLAGWGHPLVLGFEREADYFGADHYAGAVIGRFANRIAGGRASLDGQDIALPANSGGHHLHGGETGLSRQVWALAEQGGDRISLTLDSPAGHEGYPGTCRITVTYAVVAPMTLELSFVANTDATTLVNLCHHPYFNFAGHGHLGRHSLSINAERFLWSGADLVPTGEMRAVAGGDYDFRSMRPVTSSRPAQGFNNTYCLAEGTRDEPAPAARVALQDGPAMELWTTQPGLHLYDGYKLREGMVGLEGRRYGPGHGLCLEAQGWPDSPNHAHFPSAVLRTDQTYRQRTEYRFSAPLERP